MKKSNLNNVKIPASFKLGGSLINVNTDDDYCSDNNCYGEADFTQKKITLCANFKGKKLSNKDAETTFYHELVHMILDACRRHNLKYNEGFVDEFGNLLHQFYTTAKYEDKE